jgi:hypothetical protein
MEGICTAERTLSRALLPFHSRQSESPLTLPSFHPAPESQPVLPALLRRLLLKGAQAEALALAKRHEPGPHFARSLEWLLFTTLDLEGGGDKKKGGREAATARGALGPIGKVRGGSIRRS